jgi:hypothetical protein
MTKNTYETVKVPFANMSWTPDVPTAALTATEYNSGRNIETDVRSVKSVLGDEEILSTIPGTAIFVTSGFRANNQFWYIVGTLEGRWYAITTSGITNVTPGVGANPNVQLPGYTETIPITASWNGTILFINDSVNVPMYLLPTGTEFNQYDAAPDNYVWNYNNDWSSLSAGFMRVFATPNVGSILIAGNLTADVISTGLTMNMPYTVRWSQAFGVDSGPTSWQPTLANVANELEVPLRGPAVDGFACAGNFYVCSYWDTVVFSPFNYQTSTAPILGVKLLSTGRGLLNENCWANADDLVYGLDARDIWVFNGSQFKPIGDQRVKNWFYDNLNSEYADRTFVINNTAKYQIEIYFADQDSTGWPNKMIGYRYDLDVWNPPRDVNEASMATQGPIYGPTPNSSLAFNDATRTVVYSQGVVNGQLVQKDQGTEFLTGPIDSEFRRDNITLGQKYSNQILVHRILPEITGTGTVNITVGGADSVGATPTFKPTVQFTIDTQDPWIQVNQNNFRVNTIRVAHTSNVTTWQMTAASWQIQIVEDSR